MLEKACRICGLMKPLTEYSPAPDTRDRHTSACKSCNCARAKAYAVAHPEQTRERKRLYALTHPEQVKASRERNKAAQRARIRASRATEPDKWLGYSRAARNRDPARFRAYRQKYYEGQKPKQRERLRTWRLKNPNYHRLKQAVRRMRQVAGAKKINHRDITRLLHRYRGGCAYCGASAKALDHIIPLARGGRHSIGNIVPACVSCNSSKRDRLLIEWRARHAATSVS